MKRHGPGNSVLQGDRAMEPGLQTPGTVSRAYEQSGGFAFQAVLLYTIITSLKPEYLVPGLSSIDAVRQVPNLVAAGIVLIWAVHYKKVFHNAQTKLVIGFFLVMVAGTLTARNAGLALPITKSFFLALLVYLASISIVDKAAKLRKMVTIFLFSNVLLAMIGILSGGLIRSIPALSDENDFSLLMNMLIPFAFMRAMHEEKKSKKFFYYGISLLFVTGVVVSFSRGGFVGLVCVLAYCFARVKRKALLVALIPLILICGALFIPASYVQEMKTLEQGMEESTAAERIYYWTLAFRVFLDHPVLGVGPGNAGVWLPDYDVGRGERHWGRVLHSLYFTLLSEQGLVGVCIFGGILYVCWKNIKYVEKAYRNRASILNSLHGQERLQAVVSRELREVHVIAHSLVGGFVGYLSSGAFLTVLYYGWFWMLVMYTVIVYNAARKIVRKYGSV